MADKLADTVKNEFQKIVDETISAIDLEKIRTNLIKEQEQVEGYNSFNMQMLKAFYRFGENMNDSINFEYIVNGMTAKDIQKIAQEIINNKQSYEIIFKPKKPK
ncbi:peptidase M16 family protein [Flavisericum labens]|uniref:hypothetical protein n=1 Tax=Flavisericum labens TaxID=3377112 RepID=UPI00387B0EF8